MQYGPTVDGRAGNRRSSPCARSIIPLLKNRLHRENFSTENAVNAAAIVKLDPSDAFGVIELATALQEEPGIFCVHGHSEAEETWSRLGTNARPAIKLLVDGCRYQPPGPGGRFFDAAQSETTKRRLSAELLLAVGAEIPRAVDALIDLTRQGRCDDRGMAADALGRLGPAGSRACSALVAMLPDDEVYILGGDFHGNGGTQHFPGERALLALSKIGVPALTPLENALKDEEPLTRQRAAVAIGLIGPAAGPAAGALIVALSDSRRASRPPPPNPWEPLGPPTSKAPRPSRASFPTGNASCALPPQMPWESSGQRRVEQCRLCQSCKAIPTNRFVMQLARRRRRFRLNCVKQLYHSSPKTLT